MGNGEEGRRKEARPSSYKVHKEGQAYRIIEAIGAPNLLETAPIYTGKEGNMTITDYTFIGHDDILARIKAQYDKADAPILFAKMQQVNHLPHALKINLQTCQS